MHIHHPKNRDSPEPVDSLIRISLLSSKHCSGVQETLIGRVHIPLFAKILDVRATRTGLNLTNGDPTSLKARFLKNGYGGAIFACTLATIALSWGRAPERAITLGNRLPLLGAPKQTTGSYS